MEAALLVNILSYQFVDRCASSECFLMNRQEWEENEKIEANKLQQ
jgi:hypothetical protein